VGSRVASLFLVVGLLLSGSTALAATKKPTPKPTAKVSAKATSKATAKSSSTTTAKATPKATKKKAVVKKKRKKRAKVRVTPSPKPSWPPKGFAVEGEVYAKIPNAKELVGLISANSNLGKQIKQCSTYICGSIQVASETGCIWWEVNAAVSDAQGVKLGELSSAFGSSKEREFKTLIVISPETVEKGGSAKITSVLCHHEDRVTDDPSTTYKKTN
jgi:hypothetical protein